MEDGVLRIHEGELHLPVGALRLQILAPERAPVVRTVEIREGETTKVDLEVP